MFMVVFNDEAHGVNTEYFDTFDDAVNYWNEYADTPTCVGGTLFDCDTSETIWSF